MAKPKVISSDDAAYDLLKRWIDGESIPEVEFRNWPILRMKISGEHYNSSVNSGQMAALVDFKMTVGRAYAALAHGAYDMRRLKQEEEEELDFATTLRPGSSIFDTDLSPLVQAMAEAVKGYPEVAIIAATVVGLALIARPVIVKYLSNKAKDLDAKERDRLLRFGLTARESDQHRLIEGATGKIEKTHPQFAQALLGAQAAYWRFASASLDADALEVAGLALTHEDLELLSERRARRPRKVKDASGVFSVKGIRKETNVRYKVQLESKELSTFAVYRRPHLTESRVRRLFSCMANSTLIRATLELKAVGKANVSSRLLHFTVVDADN